MVEHFTRRLLQDTLPLVGSHLGLKRRDYTTASDDEVFRIQRAIYRFQLYCNLLRYPYNREQRRRLGSTLYVYFFNAFSPWINEQLACIHDYFERVLSRTFDEVAAHDIEWACKPVNWQGVGQFNEHKQGFLLYGLDFLYKLDRAETYDERREILRIAGESPLPRTKAMLGGTFSEGSTIVDRDEWYWFWEHIDEFKEATDLGVPARDYWVDSHWCTNGPDVYMSGPFRVWRLAHEDCWKQDVIYHANHDWLRRCGYVLWDAPKSPMSNKTIRMHIKQARRQSLLNHFRRNDSNVKAKMKRSRRERAAIYQRGGRGYWSEGDLSRIVWTEPTEEQSPVEPIKGQSTVERKEQSLVEPTRDKRRSKVEAARKN